MWTMTRISSGAWRDGAQVSRVIISFSSQLDDGIMPFWPKHHCVSVEARTTRLEPGGDTIFEIASLTNVFTALLLADAVRRGDVQLDDPQALT